MGLASDDVDVSILVPAKDEEHTVLKLADEVERVMATLAPLSYELIFVDDGSADATWEQMTAAVASSNQIRAIRLRRNFGKAAALSAGVAEARGRVIVTMDADLQDDPNEIPRLLAGLDEGNDLVTGHKKVRHDPLGKRLPSKLFNWATGVVTGLKLNDHNSGLRAALREVYDAVPLYGELHRYVPALAHANGFRVAEIPVNHRPREHGRSKYGFERYARGALDLLTVVSITRFGRRPSHLLGGFGLLFGLIGMAILLYLTGVWVFTERAIGSRPLLLLGVLLVMLAVQLLGMGLIAELLIHRTHRPAAAAVSVAKRVSKQSARSGVTGDFPATSVETGRRPEVAMSEPSSEPIHST
jgi:dolichol-phosphate mannosyltransferase